MLNPKGMYLSVEKGKENLCVAFSYSIKQPHEIRRFHVAYKCAKKRDACAVVVLLIYTYFWRGFLVALVVVVA